MRLNARTKSQIVGFTDHITSLALRVGIPIFLVAVGYLLFVSFGPHLRNFAKMSASDSTAFAYTVNISLQAMTMAALAVVISFVIRHFNEEPLGHILSGLGAALYFASPVAFAQFIPAELTRGNQLLFFIVGGFRYVGTVCLIPGLFLVIRNAILRIWQGVSVRRILERRWGDEEKRKKLKKPKIYGACWELEFCRDYVRDICPAFKQKKPCWRLKVGCYCDEKTIMHAITSFGGKDNNAKDIMSRLGLDKPGASQISSAQKRARCKRCGIYSEHQRQKYRLFSPMVFPAVGLAIYLNHDSITKWIWTFLAKTDQFMRFLTYKVEGTSYSFTDDGNILTTLAIVWLTIIAISYSLRFLEYLVFELQV